MKFRRKFFIALFVAAAIFALQAIVAAGIIRKDEPIEIPAEIAPVVAVEPQAEQIPDPCGLETVVCDGEEAREVTAYTSEISQTDGSPCISANGTNICEMWQDGINVCAANFVPFGTKLEVEGLGTCVVVDRMNRRFPETVDWYFGYDTKTAIQFGRKTVEVRVLSE